MILLRSLAFNALFFLSVAVIGIGGLPAMPWPNGAMRVAMCWARWSLFLLRTVAGVRLEVRGREKLPPGGCLVAAKHQSALETVAMVPIFDEVAFVLKRELNWIPVFGWYTARTGMIPVDRGKRSAALRQMAAHARRAVARGRRVLIFPEGTRRPVDAEPAYKYGVVHLYTELGVPCVPVALNTGLFWPRRTFLKRPGTAVIEILDPIPPGLDTRTFRQQLEEALEPATARLVAEGRGATTG